MRYNDKSSWRLIKTKTKRKTRSRRKTFSRGRSKELLCSGGNDTTDEKASTPVEEGRKDCLTGTKD
jgi:hypothetical protein